MSKQFCVFGNPIDHSLSPLMHNYAFKKLESKIDFMGSYGRYCLENKDELKQKFFQLGLSGANITIPFKEEAFLQSDEVVGIAKKIKAVNTWVLSSNGVCGYNTDAQGFYETIRHLDFKKFLILGAGGSARAVAYILKEFQKDVVILNRSKDRFRDLEQDFLCATPEALLDFSFDMVINTTSASLQKILPFEEIFLQKILSHTKFAYDLMYGDTPFLKLATMMKIPNCDGKNMLIAQGALAFELFCQKTLPETFLTMQEALQ